MNWIVAISLFVSSIPIVKFVAEGIGVRAIQKTPSSKCKANTPWSFPHWKCSPSILQSVRWRRELAWSRSAWKLSPETKVFTTCATVGCIRCVPVQSSHNPEGFIVLSSGGSMVRLVSWEGEQVRILD
jgi:hypothetical protein